MRILVLSASRPAALALARVLRSSKHVVIAADYEMVKYTSPARYSRAISLFFPLYGKRRHFWSIIQQVDLVIPFGDEPEALLQEISTRATRATMIYHPVFENDHDFQTWARKHVAFDALTEQEDGFGIEGAVYSTHMLITASTIQNIVVTAPAEGLRAQDYMITPSQDPLHALFLSYNHVFVSAFCKAFCGDKALNMHLSLTFAVTEHLTDFGIIKTISPISCSNKPHDSLILLLEHLGAQGHAGVIARSYADPGRMAVVHTSHPEMLPTIPHGSHSEFNVRGTYSLPRVIAEFGYVLRSWAKSWGRDWRRLANLVMMAFVWGLWFKEEYWFWKDKKPALVQWFARMPLEASLELWERVRRRWSEKRRVEQKELQRDGKRAA